MSRSTKKGPYVDRSCSGRSSPEPQQREALIKTWSRDSTIFPEWSGPHHRRARRAPPCPDLRHSENMVGHKLGEFAPTRTFRGHAGGRTTNVR